MCGCLLFGTTYFVDVFADDFVRPALQTFGMTHERKLTKPCVALKKIPDLNTHANNILVKVTGSAVLMYS